MAKPLSVDETSWDKEVLQSKELVMVDFWAAWCGPCQMIAPIIEELAGEYEGKVKVCKINTDENPTMASRYQIMGIPALIFFKEGLPIDKIVGAASKKQFQEKMDSLLAN